jgi:hypothetical protein
MEYCKNKLLKNWFVQINKKKTMTNKGVRGKNI